MIALPEWLEPKLACSFSTVQDALNSSAFSITNFPMPAGLATNGCTMLVGLCQCGKTHVLADWSSSILAKVIDRLVGATFEMEDAEDDEHLDELEDDPPDNP